MKNRKLLCLLPVLLLLLCACGGEEAAYPDANLEYLRQLSEPTEGVIYYSFFEKQLYPTTVRRANEDGRGFFDPEILAEIAAELMERLGQITTPLPDCAEYCNYELRLRIVDADHDAVKASVKVHFLEQDGKFFSPVYVEVGRNHVWYTFDDPEGFVKKYWALGATEEP